ncbi:hypothetical protein J7L48_09075, partial [bacterium]|nr:hypothetical protein [bacterium]
MKKWLLILLLSFSFKLFAFEIIVIGIKDTNAISIKSQDLYSSIADIQGLSMRNYSLGSGVFLSYPGLSAVNTSIVFSGITLNSLKLGTFDLANFPQFLLTNVNYYDEDISFINGINGMGGGININYSLQKELIADLYIDTYYSDLDLVIPFKRNSVLFNIMYENRIGNAGRTNSDFKRNYYGFSITPTQDMQIIYT